MRSPDQIPNLQPLAGKHGDVVYFWTGRAYSKKKLISPHADYAAVTIADGHGPLIVRPTELISADAYKGEQREEARQRYAEIITHWNNGLRTSQQIAPLLKGKFPFDTSARACGQMIAAAKRWGLLVEDPKP